MAIATSSPASPETTPASQKVALKAGKNATVGLPYGLVTRGYPGAKHVRAFDSGSPSKKGETTPELVKPADTMVETMASIDASPYITEPAS